MDFAVLFFSEINVASHCLKPESSWNLANHKGKIKSK